MRFVSLAVLASASIFVAAPALAQAPQLEKNVSMGMALAIIQGTLDQCTKDGYKVSVPIKVGNEVIGGVGVSGAPGGEKDEVCANAGIAKVEAALK
jgi:uncharacterized protein GlcG (DUF336 family)